MKGWRPLPKGSSMAAEGDRLSLPEIHRIKGKAPARSLHARPGGGLKPLSVGLFRSLAPRRRGHWNCARRQSGAALGREWQAGPR